MNHADPAATTPYRAVGNPADRMVEAEEAMGDTPRQVTNWLECVRCHTPTDLTRCPKCGDPVRVRS